LAEGRHRTGENYCASCGHPLLDRGPQVSYCDICGSRLFSPLILNLKNDVGRLQTELKSALAKATAKPEVASGVLILIDGENLYMKTSEYLKMRKLPADMAASNDFIIQKIQGLVDFVEDTYRLRIYLGYYYMTKKGEEDLRRARLLEGFTNALRSLHIDTVVTDKPAKEDTGGGVDPKLISDAYRLMFVKKQAPSMLLLVSGDADYVSMLIDYIDQGRRVVISFYQPVGGGASMSLLAINSAPFLDITDPKQFGPLPLHPK
jgi:uncharacterized LabA/DUF88 family protein